AHSCDPFSNRTDSLRLRHLGAPPPDFKLWGVSPAQENGREKKGRPRIPEPPWKVENPSHCCVEPFGSRSVGSPIRGTRLVGRRQLDTICDNCRRPPSRGRGVDSLG